MTDERAQMDELLGRAISLAQRSLDATQSPGVLVEGTAQLLARPELENLSRVRLLFDMFADRRNWSGCSISAWTAAACAWSSARTAR